MIKSTVIDKLHYNSQFYRVKYTKEEAIEMIKGSSFNSNLSPQSLFFIYNNMKNYIDENAKSVEWFPINLAEVWS